MKSNHLRKKKKKKKGVKFIDNKDNEQNVN